MATKVEIASNALIRIGANPISSFDEGGAAGVAASNLYEPTIASLLSDHTWRFCFAKRDLARLTAVPLNEWQYAFQIPSDSIRIFRTYPNQNYRIFERKIYANSDTLSIDYQFRAPEANWPPYFQLLAEFVLASEFALSVTSNQSNADLYFQKANQQMRRAKYIDSQSQPNEEVQSVPYRDVRG